MDAHETSEGSSDAGSGPLEYSTEQVRGENFDSGWLVGSEPDSDEPPDDWRILDPPVLEPSDPEYLCEACRHINFASLFCMNSERRKILMRHLSAEQLRQNESCSFCRLIVFGLLEDGFLLEHDQTLRLYLDSRYEPEDLDYTPAIPSISILVENKTAREKSDSYIHIIEFGTQPLQGRLISPYFTSKDCPPREWLETCESEHSITPRDATAGSLTLIDVQERCTVHATIPCRYAALSYVWGQVKQMQYMKDTRDILEKPGSLQSDEVELPQTIKDAIDLTALLGIPYLWVDSLCILQDDSPHKSSILKAMGRIYGEAVVTIVDGYGEDASSGLPGVSIPRAKCQEVVQVQAKVIGNLKYAADSQSEPPWENPLVDIRGCKWFRRGWTFQEMALSKRLLVLGHKYARLICEHELFLEEFIAGSSGCSHFRTNPYRSYIKRFEFLDRSWWYSYFDAVFYYTRRDLTFQEDIISAFEGVADVLQAGTATTFIFNLPDTEMDEALLWYPWPRDGRYEGELRRSSEKIDFPSWSWAGWQYYVCYAIFVEPCASTVAWLCRSRKYPG